VLAHPARAAMARARCRVIAVWRRTWLSASPNQLLPRAKSSSTGHRQVAPHPGDPRPSGRGAAPAPHETGGATARGGGQVARRPRLLYRALVSVWPALALVGSFELLMLLIRTQHQDSADRAAGAKPSHAVPALEQDGPPAMPATPSLEQTIRAWYSAGHSQRAISRDLNIDRRKVKQIIERAA
jgi:hypothetical protein